MADVHPDLQTTELLTEVDRLRRELDRLRRENTDLEIALLTTAEHGDFVESQLHAANLQLQSEIAERKRAQATLQQIFETVSSDKADLELILQATAEHGDALEYQLYTQAVASMRHNQELLRAIAESTPILMFLTQKADGAITYANSTASTHLGTATANLIGRNLRDFYTDPADAVALQAQFLACGAVRNYELQITPVDGDRLWVSASVHPLPFDAEHTLLTTFYDISDRKQAEALLKRQTEELERRVAERTAEQQQAEAKYRSIFENAVEGLFQTSPEGRFLSANPALAEIHGYESAEKMIDTIANVGKLYVQSRRRDELLAYLKRFDSVTGFESQVYRKDGSTIWISESMRVIRAADHTPLHYEGSVQDITSRRATEAELNHQRQVTERLLLNMLPQPIAERLKRGQTPIADHFAEATVLFADIANFTALSAQIAPVELVELLNRIFSRFDNLTEQHGLEKIKTIGDAYMVAGGLPNPRPDHVTAIADMALDLHQAIAQFKTPTGQPIALRIGIHTGSVVAGIIGVSRLIYDLWGDTVNVASRMESQGEVGRIQVTEAVYDRLRKRYLLEERGILGVKGKGLMTTYWLLARKPTLLDT